MYILDNFGVELRFKEIFSRGKDTMLSDEHYEILKQCSEFLKVLDQRLMCYDGTLTEEKYVKVLNNILPKFGTWKEGIYYPNNPNQILGVLIDHVSLIKASQGHTKKEEMDAVSRASVILRNTTGIISPIHVSQFNRNANSDERLKQAMQDPGASDFKDSGSLYEDSSVVIALHSPHKFKLSTYRKYNIKELEQIFIGVFLLKSRFGTSDIMVPMAFYGDSSSYKELPKSEDIYDYERYKTPFWDKEIDKDEETKSNFKFIL